MEKYLFRLIFRNVKLSLIKYQLIDNACSERSTWSEKLKKFNIRIIQADAAKPWKRTLVKKSQVILAFEVLDDLKDELGDLLLHVIFDSQLAN